MKRLLPPSLLGLVAFQICFLVSSSGFGACHVVTPTGSGAKTGADWNNAFAGLPSTLTRGDTYYLADGNYPSYTFNTPNSGTTVVTIKKARVSDNCTNTGWNTSTMGSSQAVFGSGDDAWLNSSGSYGYVTVDGNGSSTSAGCGTANGSTAPDCGIKFNGVGCSGYCKVFDETNGGSHTILRYVEVQGAGTGAGLDEHDTFFGGGSYTLNHYYGHDSSCDLIQTYSASSASDPSTIENSYFANIGHSSCHPQALWDNGSSNLSIFNNVFRNIQGTAVLDELTGSSGSGNNWAIYNNTFFVDSTPPSGYSCLGDGIAYCGNPGVSCNNWTFVQNNIVGFPPDSGHGGPAACGSAEYGVMIGDSASGTGWIVENNIWYGDYGAYIYFTGTENYNSFLNSGSPGRGSNDITVTSNAPNPFTNLIGGVFTLLSDNTDWTGGLTLSSPYNVDPTGVARGANGTWERGVYALGGSQVNPPTGLVATPH